MSADQPPSRTPWRCRHGWHRWFFVSMRDSRMIEVPGHSSWVCTLVERCGRCGLRQTLRNADVPKHPRVLHASAPGREPSANDSAQGVDNTDPSPSVVRQSAPTDGAS